MKRTLLAAGAAAAPLLLALSAPSARAETTVTTAVTAPVRTSTAATGGTPDDVKVTSTGSIKPTASGVALTMDSNNDVTNEGAIAFTEAASATGILATGGLTGDIVNNGSISLTEDFTGTDADSDGDLDGPFAEASNQFGIRVTGTSPLVGSVSSGLASSINVEGNNSAGVWIEPGLTGSLLLKGAVNVTGDNSYGVRVQGPITGDVEIRNATAVLGAGSTGVSLEDDIGGGLLLQNAISATGYRYTTRPASAEVRGKLDADDLKIGGSAVVVAGDVGGGILLDTRPADEDEDDADEDDDGVPDASEGTATLVSVGSAPALLIGAADRSVTIGAAGTGDEAFGLIIRGGVTAAGVYDGKAATAIQIGGRGGDATTIAGGAVLAGTTSALAYEADATALRLGAGAVVDSILHSGSLTSNTVSEGDFTARGIQVEVGATTGLIRNTGTIAVGLSGETGDAIAIQDLSGAVDLYENSGKILAQITPTDDANDDDDDNLNAGDEVITGQAIAIDARASTTGVRIVQTGVIDGDDGDDDKDDPDADGDGVDDTDESYIIGDVLLGSGADRLEILNGNLSGAIAFGAGANSLVVDGTGVVRANITATDGTLDITVGGGISASSKGTLNILNTGTITGDTLSVGSGGLLIATIDPDANAQTRLVMATANFADGAQVDVNLKSLLPNLGAEQRFVIVDADVLTAGAFNQTALGDTPYLFVAEAGADLAAGEVYVDVRRRTAAEIGMIASEATAYDAVYQALGKDDAIRDAFLAQSTQEGFLGLYDQMLPSQGEGIFESLDGGVQSIAQATSVSPMSGEKYGGNSLWLQEINVKVERDRDATLGGDATTFGLVGGYESMTGTGGALGVTAAYVNIEEKDESAAIGEKMTSSLVEGGAYWRQEYGDLRVGVRGAAGYGWFESTRRFVLPGAGGVTRTAEADWTGWYGTAHAFAAYEAGFNRYYLRPELSVDYLYLSEDERQESGGGDGFDLTIESRASDRLSAQALLTFGAQFGERNWFRPEIYAGYRQIVSGQIGDTVASFPGGTPFTLVAADADDGWVTTGFALSAGTPLAYVALHANADLKSKRQRYSVKLLGRAMF